MTTINKIRTKPCKHYFSNKGCRLGDACNFMHETKPSLDESPQIGYKGEEKINALEYEIRGNQHVIEQLEDRMGRLMVDQFMMFYNENEDALREPLQLWFEYLESDNRRNAHIQRYMDDALNGLRDSVQDLTPEQEQDAYNFIYGKACDFGYDEMIHELVDKSLDEDFQAMAAYRPPSMAQIVKVVPKTPKKAQIEKVAPWAPTKEKRDYIEGESWGDFECDNE